MWRARGVPRRDSLDACTAGIDKVSTRHAERVRHKSRTFCKFDALGTATIGSGQRRFLYRLVNEGTWQWLSG
jgi:hypothetical protein